jgi:hypothetical protein
VKIKFWVQVGICKEEETVDLESWGIDEHEWKTMTAKNKNQLLDDWAANFLDMGYSEAADD